MTISCPAHGAAAWLISFSSVDLPVMSKQGITLPSLCLQRFHSRMMQNQQTNQRYLLLFTIKFYFWGIEALFCIQMWWEWFHSSGKCSGNLITEYTCWKKMLAPGQIKRLLLNRNRLVRSLAWKCSTEGEDGGLNMPGNRSAATWLL